MGRLLLFFALLALLIAIVVILMTIVLRTLKVGQKILVPFYGQIHEGEMIPTPFQKITYVALIVLLFGVATGWLGGL